MILLLRRRKERAAKILLIGIVLFQYGLSIQPIAFLLTESLERRYARASLNPLPEHTEVIVILAGGADKPEGRRPFPELAGASWRRLWRGIESYHAYEGRIPLLYSGASGDPFDPYSGEPLTAKEYAVAMGIPEQDFLIESESRTTAESGKSIRRLLDAHFPDTKTHRIGLVTSLAHMPRSITVMKREGIEAFPILADVRSSGVLHMSPLSFFPTAEYFGSSVFSIREWVGSAGYSVMAVFDKE